MINARVTMIVVRVLMIGIRVRIIIVVKFATRGPIGGNTQCARRGWLWKP